VGFDPFLTTTAILLVLTMGIALLYYKRIRRVNEEYEKAKGVVGDMAISFDRQLERQGGKLSEITRRTDSLSSKNEMIIDKIGKGEAQLATFASEIKDLSKTVQEVSGSFERMEKKLEEMSNVQDRITQRVDELEKTEHRALRPKISETKIETVIPIKKEKALAPLTETELGVLEILAVEGEKTASEIKKRIQLSREHTSRLMRKLYEDGYLERDIQKIPYTYHVKEEMLKILKKKGQSQV
jgi:uncharacterized protein YoxC